jgi:DNA mismatch repair protein MutS2
MTINLITTNHSVHHGQVEWDILSKIIAEFAYFESNKHKLTSTLYEGKTAELLEELAHIASYQKHFKEDYRGVLSQLFSRLASDASTEKLLAHVDKQGILSFAELNRLAKIAEIGIFIKQDFPTMTIAELQQLTSLDLQPVSRKFLKEFRHLVDDDGEIHFERHPELADLTRRLRDLEERIRKSVQEWISDPAHQKILQFNSYDVHFDRYVVPVRSDSYRSEIGLIVSRSDSGSTLYVEPFLVREACNRRLELIAKIDEIINQLAGKFSRALAEFVPVLKDIYHLLLRIDHYLAKNDFSLRYKLERPRLKEKPGFKFTGLFHPLLKDPVKNSADCDSVHHGIVISGPNTGGKTVFLKSIALSYLLFYHGFYVPAAEAELYPYQGVFYFGNDLQDLKAGLSSFSGEVQNYIQLIDHILPSNLILIDEIFNSTSSDEASALSLAYFDELHRRAICHLVVSTHHQMFKTLIHQDRHYLSCHVGFDTKNMKPTYKIQWGTPGSSMAIDIFRIMARQHEKVQMVPDRALTHLSSKNISYETLLQKVSQKQIELDQLLGSNRQLEIELKNQKGAMEGILNLKLNEELHRARKEIDRLMQEARTLVEEAKRQEITKTKRIDDKQHHLKQQLSALSGGTEEEITDPVFASDLDILSLGPGDSVYSLILKKDFIVHKVELRKKEVVIAKGPIKLTVPVNTLKKTAGPKGSIVSVSYQKDSHAEFDIDARGMRLSEFQSKIDKALGDLLTGDIPFLNVIHGHGDGVLKNWLRDYLKRSKDFKGEIPENGNDGETKITIK